VGRQIGRVEAKTLVLGLGASRGSFAGGIQSGVRGKRILLRLARIYFFSYFVF